MDNEIRSLSTENYNNFIQETKFRTYVYNRIRTPATTVHEWSSVFGVDVYLYEIHYQNILQGGMDGY